MGIAFQTPKFGTGSPTPPPPYCDTAFKATSMCVYGGKDGVDQNKANFFSKKSCPRINNFLLVVAHKYISGV